MTDTPDRKPEWLKLPPIPAELREAFDAVDLSDPDTWGVLVYDEVGEVTDDDITYLRDRIGREQFAREMAHCRSLDADPEAAHGMADDLMVRTLTAHGYDCSDFLEMRRWYA